MVYSHFFADIVTFFRLLTYRLKEENKNELEILIDMRNTRSKTRILIKSALAIIMIGLMHPKVYCQEDEKKHWIGAYLTTPTMTSIRDGKSSDLNI